MQPFSQDSSANQENKYPNSREIKKQFLEFFKSKNHVIVPSAPIVVKGDPTLMFTNAGMNQFKDYFLGNATAPYKRVADTQKCLRVSGKQNDLEEVGHDHYHHTMFEMLGNWSFGDYYKEQAIAWAWELLTDVYKLDKNRLYVTVFEGDEQNGIPFDQEAYDCWKKWIAEDRILKGNKKDNFWEMGDTGPCGPCTEIHYDGRNAEERNSQGGAELVNNDHPDVIEIWNNVFMEFNRKADGSLEKLPAQHVDTGMGFERLTRIIQGKKSNYDTDIFTYLINKIENLSEVRYGNDPHDDIAHRVIADHIRAVSLCIADGQLPSNTGAGYVVRRILRRAVRYGFSYLNLKKPFLCEMVPELAEYFSDVFPELIAQKDFVAKVIREEENSFFRTLSNGIQILNQHFEKNIKELDGKTAFELYDTFGFPIDLTELICREKGISVDKVGFNAELELQKQRSRSDAEKVTGDWHLVLPDEDEIFTGYDQLECNTQISRYRTVTAKGKDQYHLVLVQSPFYAESGGQVGDTGTLTGEDGEVIQVLDCQKENKLHVLYVNKIPAQPAQTFKALVNAQRRHLIEANHSATHLMHSALREILGNHVAQKGSLVNDKILRFDFSHNGKTTDEEITAIEKRVNNKIAESIALTEYREIPIDKAKQMGATALFGEKYGDKVRVIVFDPKYSMELCGGTHVDNTSKIGLFKITAESSVAAGIRRIEAVTSAGALELLNNLQEEKNQLLAILNNNNPVSAVQKLNTEIAELKQKLEKLENASVNETKTALQKAAIEKGGITYLISKVNLPGADYAKQLAFQFKNEYPEVVCVLAYEAAGKPGIAIMFSDKLVEAKNWDAVQMVRELGKEIQGGGGGQKFFATAGGKEISGLDRVVTKAREMFAL